MRTRRQLTLAAFSAPVRSTDTTSKLADSPSLRGAVVERRLHADIAGLGTIRDAHIVAHRTSARLDRRDHGAQAQRTRGVRILRRTRIERR